MCRDGVGEPATLVDARHRRQDFRRDLLVELDVLVELREQRTAHCLDFVGAARFAGHRYGTGDHVLAAVFHRGDLCALRALDQDLNGAVGKLQHLQDRRDRADLVQVLRGRVVLRRLLLRDEQDVLAGLHRHVERLDGLGPPDEQRDDHVRKDHDVAQRKQRERGQIGGEGRVVGHTCLERGRSEAKMGAPRRPVKPPIGSNHTFSFGF